MNDTTRVGSIVRPGHGVASGQAKDPRYPTGTLRQQLPHFLARGLDLSAYYLGTVNVDIAPHRYEIREPKHFVENVDWPPHIPPENFYFFDVVLRVGERPYLGLVYLPDPATKQDHFQAAGVLELLLPVWGAWRTGMWWRWSCGMGRWRWCRRVRVAPASAPKARRCCRLAYNGTHTAGQPLISTP